MMKRHLKWKNVEKTRWKKVKFQWLKKEGAKYLHNQLPEGGFFSLLHNNTKSLATGVQDHKDLNLK